MKDIRMVPTICEGELFRKLQDAAATFRDALNRIDPDAWHNSMVDRFPVGACGLVSELLGRFIKDELGLDAEYVLCDFYEEDGTWRTGHAWLEINGIIVDITGDQFGWDPVVVSRGTAKHASGILNLRQPLTSDLRWWDVYAAPLYASALKIVKAGGA